MTTAPLRICFLTYRGNPHCGGQGIYTHYLTRELTRLGHKVDVWSGQPYPELDESVALEEVPSLDLWNEEAFFRLPTLREARDPINRREWIRTVTGGFPEPLTFTQRVLRKYRELPPGEHFDVVHDNQCLGEGLLELRKDVPIVATIHHPITKDRKIALAATKSWRGKLGLKRWYTFIPMQLRVARELDLADHSFATVRARHRRGIRSRQGADACDRDRRRSRFVQADAGDRAPPGQA